MSDVTHLPLTPFAEHALIRAGHLVDDLKSVPLAELGQVNLCTLDGKEISPYEAIMRIAQEMAQLAEAVEAYRRAQEFTADILLNGRLKP